MPDTHSIVKSSLSFAKLVATPTETAWSQAYNAGNLFVCLTLIKDETDEDISLQAIGKEIMSILESEFFTLEEKNSDSIKKALITSLENTPPEVKKQLTVANYKNDVLTVFIAGCGKVILKREDKIGTLLEKYDEYIPGDITSASGYLNNKDLVILESGEFAKKVSEETIRSALELNLPIDIVETLTPQIHGQKDGAQSAIVVLFHSSQPQVLSSPDLAYPTDQTLASLYTKETNNDPTIEETLEKESDKTDAFDEPESTEKKKKKLLQLPRLKLFSFKKPQHSLNHRKKLYLTITIILALLFAFSIIMAIQNQKNAEQKAVFENTYIPAKQYYEEGQGLESLNYIKSQESYKKAEQRLQEGEERIDRNSPEGKQIQELLTKVENALHKSTQQGQSSEQKESTVPENSLLAIEQKNPGKPGYGQDGKNVYMVDNNAIFSFTKSTGTKKEILKNKDFWEAPKGIATYQTNLYVLDQKKGILKIVGGTTVSDYFTSDSPDLSSANSIAIDGSVWILTKNGSISKYTKAKKDTFTLSGLTTNLKSPSKLYTNSDSDFLYILDNGNSRIVKTDKKGVFQQEFIAPFITQAKDFDIIEAEKKAYILSGSKIYELAL